MDVIIWIFIAIVFVILELVTTSFFLVWFGVSSIIAAILSYLGFNVYIQFTAFAIVSLILILSTRKFADKISPKPSKKTTAERLIGKNAKIIKKIDDTKFIIDVNGEKWSAYSENSLNVNDTVEIIGIDSIKLIIKGE